MDSRVKVALAITGVAIVAYSIGYQKAQSRTIQELGGAAAKEALIYLATQDHIRNRYGR
jgi:hypothetical protein